MTSVVSNDSRTDFEIDKDSVTQNIKPVYGEQNNNWNLTRSSGDGHCPLY